MSAVTFAETELVDDAPFFAPVASDLLDSLIGQYDAARRRIEEVAGIVSGDAYAGVMDYFVIGNARDDSRHSTLAAARLFKPEGAIAALNSAYWSKALALTDVLDMMPQKRRTEWHESIREHKAPEFTEGTVRSTITELLNMRSQFLAERVDGIFRGLSGEHVTNAPEAFGKRMIVAYVLNGYGSISYVGSERAGLINDLRCVIAKFMGRDEPGYSASQSLLDRLRGRWGEWVSVDGGALRIRLYRKGTAHIEVHPDMAWRLNCVLAQLYPLAIPAQFRARPPKRAKTFKMIDRPLPFAVLALLTRERRHGGGAKNRFSLGYYGVKDNRTAYLEACRVLASIGGVPDKDGTEFAFDYDPSDVLAEIVTTGCIPDQHSHQFYPTPEVVARAAAELAEIGDADTVLEPSAGHGDLAAFLPIERTTCVEISALRCAVLKARGFDTIQADFLAWAERAMGEGTHFDRVVANPPYSEGRWKAHTHAAAPLVAPGGRLVAVLPASARNSFELPGFACTWSRVFDNEFAGTSVAVAILLARRGAA